MIFLSYIIESSSPLYGNSDALALRKTSSIHSGDTSNNTEITLPAHCGTHIDAPYHFDNAGNTIEQYPANYWTCTSPYILEYKAGVNQIIGLDEIIEQLQGIPASTDILILKTNFGQFRKSGPESEYIFNGPGLSPEIGVWLRKNLNLKMIGFDFISLSSYSNRELGREAHKAFLCKNYDGIGQSEPILIIEDMDLTKLERTPDRITVLPLRYENSDGAPVTVVAEY